MNDAKKVKLSDLSVTDLDDTDWDKYTLIVQCDECNNPVNLDDEGTHVSETKVYCKECVKQMENKYSFMDNIKRDKFHFYYPFLDKNTNKKSNQ